MAQKLTKTDLEYIKKNYKHRSNRQLAEDLKVDKNIIVHALNSLGLRRTRDEELKLKTKTSSETAQSVQTDPLSAAVPFSFHRIVLIILFGLVFLIYADSFANKFLWDDEILVVQNNYIKDWNHIPDFFTQNAFKGGDRDSNFWRPVQLFSYLVDYKTWGLNPFGFHLTNTILHGLVSLMVYIFVFLLFRKKELALLVALLYAVHPIHTEAVTYISGRADSQSSFFILLSLCFYIRYTQSANRRDILLYIGSFLSFILALMSKELATMLPAYFLLTDLVTFKDQKRKSWSNIILRYLPMLALLAFYLYLRATILDFADIPLLKEQPARQIPIFLRFMTFTRSLLGVVFNNATQNLDFGYLWLLLFPFNLHMERGTPYAKSFHSWPYLLCFLGFIALVVATVFFYRKSKIRFFGLAFFLVSFFPFMDFIPLNANMAEHWLYIPSIGVLIFLSDVCVSLLKFKPHHSLQEILKKITFSPIPIYVIYCAILTIIRNLDWKDEFTIWKETARLSNSSHIHGNLGVAYGRKGDMQSSKQEFIKALRLQFNYPEAHNNLGVIFLMEGKLEEAKKEFEYAIQFNPNYSNAYKNLGDAYAKLNNPPEAKKMWQKALEINPYHEEAKKRLEGK